MLSSGTVTFLIVFAIASGGFGVVALVRRRAFAERAIAQRKGGRRDEVAMRKAMRSTMIAGIGFLVLSAFSAALLAVHVSRG